ncbi:GIY-YIG nuclease family protein [Priestia megaterium]|uniref:GIY-YIG nuclease family protein n=1 Tax=Priestia megaterium TaxID=1404 RepID=UPI0028776E72|nr:GIY-YIG nuclease family protein [Priestia megaterium]
MEKDLYLRNLELEIKVEQLELENKRLKEELKKMVAGETYFGENSESTETMRVFEAVEKKLNHEEIVSEEAEIYKPIGSLNKRDKSIVMALSEHKGLGRDDIIKLFFSKLANPPNSANAALKRLVRDGVIRVDKNRSPYVYHPKHILQKPSYKGYVYIVKEFHSGTYKIGKSKNIEDRLRMFNVKLPFEWDIIHSFHVKDYSLAEKLLHKRFIDKRIKKTEWFNLNDADISLLQSGDIEELKELILE